MSKRIILGVLAVVLAAGVGLLAFSAPRSSSAGPSSETLRLEVDLSERTLSVVENGEVTQTHPVTVGSSEHPTPRGSYRIDWLVWNPSWNPPASDWARGKKPVGPGWNNPMGRVKMFFKAPTFYIHGTRAISELGEAASHGCVRMSNADVLRVARIVMEHGGEKRPPNWFKRVINRIRDTEEVRLTNPVPVTITG
jgi:lipoprotein-anchoring transpeptidase ErfK/SrfK